MLRCSTEPRRDRVTHLFCLTSTYVIAHSCFYKLNYLLLYDNFDFFKRAEKLSSPFLLKIPSDSLFSSGRFFATVIKDIFTDGSYKEGT